MEPKGGVTGGLNGFDYFIEFVYFMDVWMCGVEKKKAASPGGCTAVLFMWSAELKHVIKVTKPLCTGASSTHPNSLHLN